MNGELSKLSKKEQQHANHSIISGRQNQIHYVHFLFIFINVFIITRVKNLDAYINCQ